MHLAWTTAAKTHQYDCFLWLNDDTALNEDAIMKLLNTSEEFNDDAVIVGSTSSKSGQITYGGEDFNGKLISPDIQPIFCKTFNGNIVLVPSKVYNILGTNDPIFRHAVGDTDYGLRATTAGIKNVVAPGILGLCEQHENDPAWRNATKSLRQRWKAFRSPLGLNPEEFFIFEKRHYGLAQACFHYFTNHIRVIFPKLWIVKSNIR